MPFNPELIQVSSKKQSKKSAGKYVNLTYGEGGTITFLLKECYSHFGISYNEEYENYNIGISIPDEMYDKLRAAEGRVETLLDKPLEKPLLRCLKKNDDGYNNLYLKLKEFNHGMLNVRHVIVNAQITLTAVYVNHTHPSLLVHVIDSINIEKSPQPTRTVIED